MGDESETVLVPELLVQANAGLRVQGHGIEYMRRFSVWKIN